MKFPCTGCGCCCKRIKSVVEFMGIKNPKDPLYFPHYWNSKGICEHLNKENKCNIYDSRPLLCNVEKLTEYLGYEKNEFYHQNVLACNKMMEEDNIPLHFRIDI